MSNSPRLAVIEYLRGFAALSVAWFHLTNTYEPGWVRSSGSLGWLGVETFFVLSGFVVPYGLARVGASYSLRDFPNFLTRRIVRLEPPYLASILLVLALSYLSAMAPGFHGQPPNWQPQALAAHLFYVIPLTHYSWVQVVYWSLAWEFAFYLTLGALFPFVGARAATLYFALLSVVAMSLIGAHLVAPIALLFVIGVALFRATQETELPNRLVCWMIIATAALQLALESMIAPAVVGVLTALVIGAVGSKALGGAAHRALLWLGKISYSLYLTHVPIGGRIVNLGRRFTSAHWQDMLLSLLALAVCLACAWVL